MYHPFFRGKQFELLTIRETANLMARSGFSPIIEPVRKDLKGLERTLQSVCDAGGQGTVIVNPWHGDYSDGAPDVSDFLKSDFAQTDQIGAGILLTADTSTRDAMTLFREHQALNPMFIHAGFIEPKSLAQELGASLPDSRHAFIDKHCGKPYSRHFESSDRVVIGDGFKKRLRNADHPFVERFSDVHITFEEDRMNGFGDFLVVGDEFSAGGGPAYTVAIHLTFIDPEKDDVMYIYHFISDTNNTPTDPAGKFGQALDKLIRTLDSGTSHLFEGEAVNEFRELHAKKHFPGLGHVKKLSMKHHIETFANYLS